MEYSLSCKDLRGLSFESLDMKLDNYTIKGFNFDAVAFKKCSLNGAVLNDCSFQGAIFQKRVDFTNATVDGATLETLLPEIVKYNSLHPNNAMNLDNIKVVGAIKEEISEHHLLKKVYLGGASIQYRVSGEDLQSNKECNNPILDKEALKNFKEKLTVGGSLSKVYNNKNPASLAKGSRVR